MRDRMQRSHIILQSGESSPLATDKRNMQHIWRNVLMNIPQQSETNEQKRFDLMDKRDEEVSHYYDKRAKDVDRLIRFGKSADDEDEEADEERLKRFHPLKQRPFHPMGKRPFRPMGKRLFRPMGKRPFHPMGKRFQPVSKRPTPRRFDTAHYRLGKRGMRSNGKNFEKFD